jgi:hypothetical protein
MTKERYALQHKTAISYLDKVAKDVNDKGCWYVKGKKSDEFQKLIYCYNPKTRKSADFIAKKAFFEYFKGEVEEGHKIYCRCDDKLCINPDHHFAGTMKDCISAMKDKGTYKPREPGFKMPREAVERAAVKRRGRKLSAEHRRKISEAHLGKKESEETKMKLSLARKGKKTYYNPSEETRIKMGLANRGEKSKRAKLKTAQVLEIRRLQGVWSAKDIAEEFGITPTHVYYIWHKKNWKHI